MSLDLTGEPFPRDDRISCTECRELAPNGRCRVAVRGERHDVASDYSPAGTDLRRRCEFFRPMDGADDQRTGRERFPLLYAEYEARFAERTRVRREIGERGIDKAKAALGR